MLYDEANYFLILEDLGEGTDYSTLYQKSESLATSENTELIHYLRELHHWSPSKTGINFPLNLELRQMNHEHIFNFPFAIENGMNLDDIQEGLQDLSMSYKTDEKLKNKILELGQVYLSTGECLLHGDYYPGSWLKTAQGLKVIDPEFGFMGPAEFDLSVFVAHMMMAQQEEDIVQQILNEYQTSTGFNEGLMAQLAGIEIMRRLIGIAQLPLDLGLGEKNELLKRATDWVNKRALS